MRPIRQRVMHYHFSLCLSRLNVDFEVIGAFVCEGEGTENIMSALKKLKSWNPDWSPLYSMVDCCSEEINAIEALFPGS